MVSNNELSRWQIVTRWTSIPVTKASDDDFRRASNLAHGGRQAAAPSASPPGTQRPRSTSCARCPALSRRRSTSLGRPMICGGGCGGPDGAARSGARTQLRPGQLRAEGLRGCEPRPCSAACAPSAVLRTVRDGGRPLPLLASAPASGSPARSSSTKWVPPPLMERLLIHLIRG